MGSEPIEEEIPIEFEDLYTEVQEAFIIYYRLQDVWDGFSGTYMGKNYTGIKDIFEIVDLPREDWKTVFDLIALIDHYRAEHIRKTKEQKKEKTS